MQVTKELVDSEILGRTVLAITSFDRTSNFISFEQEYRRQEDPIYVTCKVPVEAIDDVHFLEDQGFRFVELQLRLRGNLTKTYDTLPYDYEYLPVSNEEDLTPVLDLASSIFEHDRIKRDPFFRQWEGRNISGERNRRYLLEAVHRKDEFVYKLQCKTSGEVVGFSSHRLLGPDGALLLIGGVKNEYKSLGVGAINDYFGLNELKRKGVRWFHTHVSGANYPILNLEVRGLGFRVIKSLVVLRKIYQPSQSAHGRA